MLQRIPDERVDPLTVTNDLPPDGDATNGQLEQRIEKLEQAVQRANADRAWIRNRQKQRGNDGN